MLNLIVVLSIILHIGYVVASIDPLDFGECESFCANTANITNDMASIHDETDMNEILGLRTVTCLFFVCDCEHLIVTTAFTLNVYVTQKQHKIK